MCETCPKVWSGEQGPLIRLSENMTTGLPFPSLREELSSNQQINEKGGDFPFLGPKQRAVTTTDHKSKEHVSQQSNSTP